MDDVVGFSIHDLRAAIEVAEGIFNRLVLDFDHLGVNKVKVFLFLKPFVAPDILLGRPACTCLELYDDLVSCYLFPGLKLGGWYLSLGSGARPFLSHWLWLFLSLWLGLFGWFRVLTAVFVKVEPLNQR
jgi:hypothetical protein